MKIRTLKNLVFAILLAHSTFSHSQSTKNSGLIDDASLKTTTNNWLESKDRDKITSVTAVLASPYIFSIVPLDEATLSKIGCRYFTDDKKQIARIFGILDSSRFRENSNNKNSWEVRGAVYFRAKNEIIARITLNQEFTNQNFIRGAAEDLAHSKFEFEADTPFSSRIYQWAALLGNSREDENSEQKKISCDYFSTRNYPQQKSNN